MSLVVCAFHGIGQFCLSCQIYVYDFFCSIFLFPLYDIVVYSNDYYLISDIGNLCWHSFFCQSCFNFSIVLIFSEKKFFLFPLLFFCFQFHSFEHFVIFLVLALGSFCPYFYDFINVRVYIIDETSPLL